MRVKFGSQLALAVLLAFVARPHEARADFAQCTNPLSACTATSSGCCKLTMTATSGGYQPLLIATDRCHQPIGTGTLAPPGSGAPRREFSISWSRSGTTVTALVTPTITGTPTPASGEVVKILGTGATNLNGSFTTVNCGGCAANAVRFNITDTTGVPPSGTTGQLLSYNPGNGWCVESPGTDSTRIGGNAADNGMLRAYGLVYRLMQRGIPVYWMVNPSKDTIALKDSENAGAQSYRASDVDLWVLTSDLTSPPTASVGLTACGVGCTQPVHRLKSADLTKYTDSYRYKQFPVRGGAFMIAAENRAAFNDFWRRQGAYSTLSATKYDWVTSGIDLYELDATAKIVYQDFTNGDGTSASPWAVNTAAPLAAKIDYEPARVACLGCNSNVAQAWLAAAGLEDPATAASCASGEFVPSDATYCLVNDYDVAQGTLVSGGFSWLWMFGYNDNNPCADSAEKAVFDKVRDFMTSIPAVRNAGHGVFLDDSIKVAEGCRGKQLMGQKQTTSDGLEIQSNGNAEPFIIRYPNNLFMQFGDLAPSSAAGTVKGWKYYNSSTPTLGYQTALQASGSSLRRLMTVDTTGSSNILCTQHTSSTSCDVFTPTASNGDLHDVAGYARLDNNFNNGLAYYLAGNQLNNNGNFSELRMLLNSLIALPDETYDSSPTEVEIARSSPIVATVDGNVNVYQGTYAHYDPVPSIPKATTSSSLARFTFPYITGHLRAIPIGNYAQCTAAGCTTSNSTRTAISGLGSLFDAANGIPTATPAGCGTKFNGSCRTVFTTLQSGTLPPMVDFTTSNVSTTTTNAATNLGVTLASNLTVAERQTLISRVLAGRQDVNGNWVSKLGGVDRSTPAVIEPSPIAGSLGRPTMIYFGATDGMMHAVCASTGGGCDQVGRELWAYIPRTILPDLRQSTARVDGSPHVIDGYGDFDNNGTNAWHTILIFHTGTGRMTANNVVPAVYAIDVTAPNNPKVLWEYSVTNVGARQTYDMGLGINIVAGTITVSNVNKTVAYVQTNNGGTGGAASVITAINVETGAEMWQFADLYPTSGGKSARNTSHEAAPSSGIPGGAVPVDTNGDNKYDKIVYGTLYGDVFVRDAGTGANQNGAVSGVDQPLLRISTDYHPIGVPPAVYKQGATFYAAFATGGYADTQATLWRGENESTVPLQMVFSVSMSYTGATINETNTTYVPVRFDMGAGEGGFAQVLVVGGELFAVSDNTNVNLYDFGISNSPTGHVYRYNFGATTPAQESTVVVASGAGSLFNNGTSLINSTGKYGERVSVDALSTTGTAIDALTTTNQLKRALWLRTE
jgi:hypothetical protein